MPALSTAVAVAEQVYPDGLRSTASSQHSSSVTTINSFATSDSPLSSDNEVFFGPLSTVELRAMKREQAHRRSTQLLTLTPLEDEEEHASERRQRAATRVQALVRGHWARREYRRALSDLDMLRTMGSASVQRRRTVRGQQTPKDVGEPERVVTPVVKRGRSIRNWFQRPQQQQSPPQGIAASPRAAVSESVKVQPTDIVGSPITATPPPAPTKLASKLKFSFNSLLSRSPRTPVASTNYIAANNTTPTPTPSTYSSDSLLRHQPQPLSAHPATSSLPVPHQYPGSNTLSSAPHIMPRQRHHPPLPPLPEYTQSSDSLGQYQQQQQQQRLKRADSITTSPITAAESKSPPPMFRQASAPTMRQTYMSMEPTLPDDVGEHEDEVEEDTDEDMGIAASVTRMTEASVEPIREDSEDDYEDISAEVEAEAEENDDDDEFLSIEEHVETQPQPQPQQRQAEEDEDVSMVDCSSSAPNADAVSFVSCTETFASSAYETVPSEAETVMPEPQEPMDHALRLSLRLSADATSFANFRLSSVIPRDSPMLTTLSEVIEDARGADNSTAELAENSLNSRNQSPKNAAAQVDPLEQEQEQEDNPVHMRLRSLRSRRLNRDSVQRPAAAPASNTTAATETSGRRFRATQTVGQKNESTATAAAGAKKKPVGKMGQIQLDRLTKLNTRRNATYMTCRIERYNITREGKRPPSPSLLMQQRAEERRVSLDHHSIYSDSDSDWDCSIDAEDEPDDSLPNGELCLEELVSDTRPLSPLLLSENDEDVDEADSAMLLEDAGVASTAAAAAAATPLGMADGGTQDIKRKSVELSAPLHPSASAGGSAAGGNAGSKKQCRRPRVHWGSRSTLRAPYLVGHAPPEPRPLSSLRSILSNVKAAELPPLEPEPSTRPMSTRRTGLAHPALKIIRVSTIKYEDSSSSEEEEEEEEEEGASKGAGGDDDEYIPKKSIRNSRKK